MKHRPHVRSGNATRSPSHEGRGDDARRSVGDVSSDPRFRATHFELSDLRLQSIGLDASRQATRAVGRRKDRSARRRRSRRDACGHRALRAQPARAARVRYHFSAARRVNSRLPISNWPDEWATRSFPCFDLARATRPQAFGSKTSWPATGGFGSWTRAWRRPLRRMALLACAFSMRETFISGLGS